MNKSEILTLLRQCGKQDLSVPESVKKAVLNNALLIPYIDFLKDLAEGHRGTPIPSIPYSSFKLYPETGDRQVYEYGETGYFPRRGRLASFGVLSWLYDQEEDLNELCDILWAICDEYTWALPAHLHEEAFATQLEHENYMVDLFASETGQALSEISFILGDRLPEIIRRRISYLVKERILNRVLEDDFRWMTMTNNWSAVCAGSVGMAAIYTLDDDEKLAAVLERILPAFEYFFSGFSADGACLEGIGYWNYGFGYFVAFADLLLRRTAGKINLFEREIVEKIALFQQKCFYTGGRTISFSDGTGRCHFMPGLSCYLDRKYPDFVIPPASCMSLSPDHCFRWSSLFRDLIWCHDTLDDTSHPACYLLPDAQWYICSSDNGVGIAAKGGHNEEPHNHNDVGNFLIYKNGEEIISDLGAGEYTKQYFDPEYRYTYFINNSLGHSVPLIDGCSQKTGIDFRARDVILTETGISMDIAPAYGLDTLTALTRDIRFHATDGRITLNDTFLCLDDHIITERFIIRGQVQVFADQVQICMGTETMKIHYDPELFSVNVHEETYSDHYAVPQRVRVLDFVSEPQETLHAVFEITA